MRPLDLFANLLQEFNMRLRSRESMQLFHSPTPQRKVRLRRGYTKKAYNFQKAKVRRKMAAASRRINRK
jgi:hypothetical protein